MNAGGERSSTIFIYRSDVGVFVRKFHVNFPISLSNFLGEIGIV